VFDAPFMQRALLELLLLAVPAGLLGSWIVLRRTAFFAHAVGTATFPGLVLADAWGVPAQPLAMATGLGFAGGVRRAGSDVATALGMVGMLALGIVLASDVYESGSGVDRLLFGSLLAVSDLDLWLTGAVAVLAVGANLAMRRTWLAAGFDASGAVALGVRARFGDGLLLGLIAAAVVVALSAVGALLVTAALVVPAATVRLVTDRLGSLQAGAVALAAVEGVAALALARALDVGPGAALAVVAAACFAAVAVVRR
jgi:manganese/iron transport system permease protein